MHSEKSERQRVLSDIKERAIEIAGQEADGVLVATIMNEQENSLLKRRTHDGRDTKTVRPIVAEVGLLPRTHGSAFLHEEKHRLLLLQPLVQDKTNKSLTTGGRISFEIHAPPGSSPYSVGEAGRWKSW